MNKFDEAIEVIGSALFEYLEGDTSNSTDSDAKDTYELVHRLLAMLPNAYVVVEWPESQELMEEEWFDNEAVFDIDCKFGHSAYLVPLKRVLK